MTRQIMRTIIASHKAHRISKQAAGSCESLDHEDDDGDEGNGHGERER